MHLRSNMLLCKYSCMHSIGSPAVVLDVKVLSICELKTQNSNVTLWRVTTGGGEGRDKEARLALPSRGLAPYTFGIGTPYTCRDFTTLKYTKTCCGLPLEPNSKYSPAVGRSTGALRTCYDLLERFLTRCYSNCFPADNKQTTPG